MRPRHCNDFREEQAMMKYDPFLLLFGFGVASLAEIDRNPAYALEFMAAILSGGLIALFFSLWKSRQRKADGVDTALWAMIGVLGSSTLAFVLAPVLDGRSIPLIGITLTRPLAAFLIAVGGTPFIEWLLTGEAFALARRWIERKEKS